VLEIVEDIRTELRKYRMAFNEENGRLFIESEKLEEEKNSITK
jgi:hypothetical protein